MSLCHHDYNQESFLSLYLHNYMSTATKFPSLADFGFVTCLQPKKIPSLEDFQFVSTWTQQKSSLLWQIFSLCQHAHNQRFCFIGKYCTPTLKYEKSIATIPVWDFVWELIFAIYWLGKTKKTNISLSPCWDIAISKYGIHWNKQNQKMDATSLHQLLKTYNFAFLSKMIHSL